MKRHRTWLCTLLGLALLVQGVSLSAAPLGIAAPGNPTTAASTESGMPCHGQDGGMAEKAAQADAPQDRCSCCDDDCPDMSSCAHAQLAPATEPQPGPPGFTDELADFIPVHELSRSPTTPLRPPIA